MMEKLELNLKPKKELQLNPGYEHVDEEGEISLAIESSLQSPSTSVATSSKRSRVASGHDSSSPLSKAFKASQRKLADEAIARWFYASAIPYNASNSSFYKDAFAKAAIVGDGYSPPKYNLLKGKHLINEYENVKKRLEPLKATWRRFGVTITSDGWSDVKKRPVINFMASSIHGTIFLRSVDVSGHTKDGEFLFRHMKEIIGEVGAENVVQIVTDNASTCIGIGDMIELEFPTIFYTKCACNCLDLLFEDIGKLDWVQPIMNDVMELVTFITRKESGLALFRRFCKRTLIKPSATRFAYMYITLRQLTREDVEEGLIRMVNDPRWASWKHSTSPKGVWMYDLVCSGIFFKEARSIITLLSPLLILLKVCDREGATMGLIYELIDSMVKSLDKLTDKVDSSRVSNLKHMICDDDDGMGGRFSMLHSPLHSVAFLLHPLYASLDQLEDNKVMADWYKYLARYTKNDINMQKRLREQHQKFLICLASAVSYITPLAHEQDEKEKPVTWWESYGTPFPDLRTMAMRILSQGTAASPCEPNWSSFSSTKKRNRLLLRNLDKLAYVQNNLRLLEKVDSRNWSYLEHDPKKIEFEEDEEQLLLVGTNL